MKISLKKGVFFLMSEVPRSKGVPSSPRTDTQTDRVNTEDTLSWFQLVFLNYLPVFYPQDFGKYPHMRTFIQEYIQALNCQNDGQRVVQDLVKKLVICQCSIWFYITLTFCDMPELKVILSFPLPLYLSLSTSFSLPLSLSACMDQPAHAPTPVSCLIWWLCAWLPSTPVMRKGKSKFCCTSQSICVCTMIY